jgi:2-C-methyl-D-erythritol 4-phosphate cytidylyltransferase/2-C-methyl-D-erythritol 2,4-cyclodiphosphate synthase
VLERAGGRVRIVEGDARLMKLTFPEDFAMAEALIPRQIRVGQGFDAHRWGPGPRSGCAASKSLMTRP